MEVEPARAGGGVVTVIAGEGELDLATAGILEERLREVSDAAAVLLDLSRVSFIDSTGVRLLVETSRARSERGARLTVVTDPASQVARILELTEATRLIELAESRESAIRRLDAGQAASAS